MKKKLLSVLLAVCMILTLAPMAMAEPATTMSAWDGNSREAIPQVNGQYQISTPAQLAQLAVDVNGGNDYDGETIVIQCDIDLGNSTFTPIGTRDNPFMGTIEGTLQADDTYPTIKNATISDSNDIINVGVFGFVQDGTVQNLVFSGITVDSNANVSSGLLDPTESSTGVAVGALKDGIINNVIVESNCSVTGILRTGGISGDISGTGQIINCTNSATVIGESDYTGGITGAAHNAPTTASAYGATITECENRGTVSGTSSVGGIVGYADRAHVSDCNNNASITGTGNYGTGGIVGANVYNIYRVFIANRKPTVATTIDRCNNSGTIFAPRAGGILGAYFSAPGDAQPDTRLDCVITDCDNSGTVTGTKVGAIFGYQISYAKGDNDSDINNMGVVIRSCENTNAGISNLSGSNCSVTIEG